MKNKWVLTSIVLVASIFFAVACEKDSTSSEPDLTGRWRGETGPNLEYQELTLIDSDGIIIGNAISKRPSYSARSGTVSGDRSDKSVTLTIVEERWTWVFTGSLDGDRISGSMTDKWISGSTGDPEPYSYRAIQ